MKSIHDYTGRLKRSERATSKLRNGDLALRFLNYLGALGLSTARISRYAGHLPTLLRVIDFDPSEATREDIEHKVSLEVIMLIVLIREVLSEVPVQPHLLNRTCM